MKGIIFEVFREMMEETFGEEMYDNLVDACDLPSGGVYSTVGTYDHMEIVSLVVELSKQTGIEPPQLVQAFGKYMFGYFSNRFPQFFEHPDTFSFLDGLNDFHQLEVMKLYPEATVPHFESRVADDGNSMELIYTSPRHFSDVAVGMLNGAFDHYNETIELTMEEIGDEQEQKVIFRMKKV